MKFEVGDKVISKYGSRDRKGTIVYIDNSSIPYKFIDDDEGLTWWLEEQDLEHIKEDLRDLLDKFLTGEYAVALRTQEEWNQFMELLESETNAVWRNDRKPTYRDYWHLNTYETSVRAYSEMNRLSYCDIDYYISKGYQIIEFSDLIKQDLRDLLQVGYKVDLKYDNGLIAKGYDVNDSMLYALKRDFDCYLNNNKLGDEITAIYKPKYNGVKPMEWVLVWEREKEKLYTLELPNTNHKHKYYRHHFNGNYNFNKGLINDASVKCMFTQEEIDNLPNQELIKVLVKKEVKGK